MKHSKTVGRRKDVLGLKIPKEIIMSRIKVKGMYSSPTSYFLIKDDGEMFQQIVEGKPFTIDNQLASWVPVSVPKKNGRGTILVCRKYADDGSILEEFPLIHNKVGLWATSSGSARNGVFHRYHEPKSELEKALAERGSSLRVISMVDSIDITLENGGSLCHHVMKKRGYAIYSDCLSEDLTEPEYAPEDHSNQYHTGCMESTYEVRVYGGTFVIHTHIHTTMNGSVHEEVQKVYITPSADLNEVARVIREEI